VPVTLSVKAADRWPRMLCTAFGPLRR
jgi:hypothetical protein